MGLHGFAALVRRRRRGTLGCTLAAGALAAAVASVAGTASTQAAPTSTAAAAGCGTVASLPIHDQSGLIATLPTRYRAAYNGYADTIYKSAWASFKPKHPAPYTIGISVTEPVNSFQAELIAALPKALHAIKGVGKVTILTSPPTGLTTQIQQTNQLIQQKVDIIVAEPLVPPAFAALAAAAGKAGIPFVSVINATPTPFSINVSPNSVLDALKSGAALAKMIAGKGTVIGVHGIPSTGVDQQEFAGWTRAFASCPGITFNTSLVGEFQIPVAKQQVLTFLSSHPQPVAGAVQAAGMTPAIIQSFQQTGRPQPAEVDVNPSEGDLAYWSAHKGSFKAVALTVPAGQLARITAYTVSHLVSGHGPKISDLAQASPEITAANLSRWATPGANVNNPTSVEGPANSFLPDSYLAPLFN